MPVAHEWPCPESLAGADRDRLLLIVRCGTADNRRTEAHSAPRRRSRRSETAIHHVQADVAVGRVSECLRNRADDLKAE